MSQTSAATERVDGGYQPEGEPVCVSNDVLAHDVPVGRTLGAVRSRSPDAREFGVFVESPETQCADGRAHLIRRVVTVNDHPDNS